ncbi:bifunctional protein-serine/threonine kinase/phosphatase [Roseomonas sp. HJA6]|uniref:Bifunctional protein-serine/threonine kinase/phosphatase n=1 Tax=Roseomonas alba TaxID=2846776 RepID=A0ABS7AAN4_9PROT|nr:bifunctional protein-serine/threonine kinase/phosphatase [Neoroseomonas alba]MBW6399150.1 bifunctional protein-serine/threonine kinase/phosphatase [Neoroseomonas alba]
MRVSLGGFSSAGRKPVNQDFHGVLVPEAPLLHTKGIAAAIADGISSSSVSHIASESAVAAFLSDYYSTPESWGVKTSARRVIAATNAWLHAQTRGRDHGGDAECGYVCTLSVLVLKAATAHIFHVGDTRIARLSGAALEPLTEDHRVAVSARSVYLGRALGVSRAVEIDYRTLAIAPGDLFLLTTDGVHEHVAPSAMAAILAEAGDDLDGTARRLVEAALAQGSPDNLTAQILRVDRAPAGDAAAAITRSDDVPLPPPLPPGTVLDGYRILRSLHESSRSHVHLAEDQVTGERVAVKVPSTEGRGDPAGPRRLMLEEWIARRVDSPHVLRPPGAQHARTALYAATAYVAGQSLAQWMRDNPRPPLEAVRDIVTQIGRGLQALHRREILHRDLRPENILLDGNGTAIIIDFGAAQVAGLDEVGGEVVPGEMQYAAPEYFLGEPGTERSDLFSLGVITYQMLTGRLPYAAEIPRARSAAAQARLRPVPARLLRDDLPAWVDGAIAKAMQIDPEQRHDVLSEFLHDLRHPNPAFDRRPRPLLERNPVRFWQAVSFILAVALLILAAMTAR